MERLEIQVHTPISKSAGQHDMKPGVTHPALASGGLGKMKVTFAGKGKVLHTMGKLNLISLNVSRAHNHTK